MAELTLWKNRETGELDPYLFSRDADEFARQINEDSKDSRGNTNK